MTDISKHPLLKACHEACITIEKLGCGLDQTDAVSRVSDMMRPIEALVDERDEAWSQLRASEERELALREILESAKAHIESAISYTQQEDGSPYPASSYDFYAYELAGLINGHLSNTSAAAAQTVARIEREALEKGWERFSTLEREQKESGIRYTYEQAVAQARAAFLGTDNP